MTWTFVLISYELYIITSDDTPFSLVIDDIELSNVSAGNANELWKALHALFELYLMFEL